MLTKRILLDKLLVINKKWSSTLDSKLYLTLNIKFCNLISNYSLVHFFFISQIKNQITKKKKKFNQTFIVLNNNNNNNN